MAAKVFRKLHQWEAHEGAIRCAAIGPTSGQIFASGGEDARVMIWTLGQGFWGKLDVPSGASSHHKVAITNVTLRPDEYGLLAGTEGGSLISFDVPKKAAVRRFAAGHMSAVNCTTYHPMNPAVIASGADDCTVRLWDGGSGSQYQLIKTDHSRVTSVTFSPSGQLLAAGTADGRIRIWDLVANKPLATVGGGGHPVVTLAYSAKDLVLVSAGGDSVLRYWNVEDGRPVPLANSATDAGSIRSTCLINDSLDCAVATCDHLKVWSVPLLPDMPAPEPPPYAPPGAPLPSYRRPGAGSTVCLDSVSVPWGSISAVWAGNIVRGGGEGGAGSGSSGHPYLIATALSGRALGVWGIDLGAVHPFSPTPYNPLCGHHLSLDATGELGGASEAVSGGSEPTATAGSPKAVVKKKVQASGTAAAALAPAAAPAPAPVVQAVVPAAATPDKPSGAALGGAKRPAGAPAAVSASRSASAKRLAAELQELDAALQEEAQAAFVPSSSLRRSPLLAGGAKEGESSAQLEALRLQPPAAGASRPLPATTATAGDSDASTSYDDDFDAPGDDSPAIAPTGQRNEAAGFGVAAHQARVADEEEEDEEEDGLVHVAPAKPQPVRGASASLDIASVLSSIAAAKASVESAVAAAHASAGGRGNAAVAAPPPPIIAPAEGKDGDDDDEEEGANSGFAPMRAATSAAVGSSGSSAKATPVVTPSSSSSSGVGPAGPRTVAATEAKQAETKDDEGEASRQRAAASSVAAAPASRAAASRLGALAPPALQVRDPVSTPASTAPPAAAAHDPRPAIIPAERLRPVGLDFSAFLPSNSARGFGMSRQIPLNASLRLMRPASARPPTAAGAVAAAPAAAAGAAPQAAQPPAQAGDASLSVPPGQWVLTALTGAGAGPKAAAAAAAARVLLQARAAALSEAASRWGNAPGDVRAALTVLRNAAASDPLTVADFVRSHRWETGALNLDTAAQLVRALTEALKAPVPQGLPVTTKQEVTTHCLAGLAACHRAFGAAAAAAVDAGRGAGADLAAEDRATRGAAYLRAVAAAEVEVGPLAQLPGATGRG